MLHVTIIWAATTFTNFQQRCTKFVKRAQSDEKLFRWLFTDSGAFLHGSDVFLLGSDDFRLDLVFHVVSLTKVFLLKKCNPVKYILKKIKKSSKVRQKKKKMISFFAYRLSTSAKNVFLQGILGKRLSPNEFFQFSWYFFTL